MIPGYILISHPDGRQQAIALRAGLLRIGSAPDNDLVLAGAGIAAHHAIICCDDQGDLLICIGGCSTRGAATEIELPRAFATALLARIGCYALRYQPAAQPSYRPSQAAPPDDAVTLLDALLDQRIVWAESQSQQQEQHEAITIEMQALRGIAPAE